jgi:hypothetical protein
MPAAQAVSPEPTAVQKPAMGWNQAITATGTTSSRPTGIRAAANLARFSTDTGVGDRARRSGVSSAETVIQIRLPATWPARKATPAAPPASIQAGCSAALRARTRASGSI